MPRPKLIAATIAQIPLAFSLSFAMLAIFIHGAPPGEVDLALARLIQRYDFLELPMRIISLPADGFIPHILGGLSVIALFALGWKRESFLLAGTTVGSAIINTSLKHWIERPRPSTAEVVRRGLFEGFSFPSGHVAFFVCYFGTLALIFSKRIERPRARALSIGLCLLPIALIPLSRVYLGAHWPSDTIGSLLWATAFVAIAWRLFHWRPRQAS